MDSLQPPRPRSRARSLLIALGVGATVLCLSAGAAWWVRGRLASSEAPGPAAPRNGGEGARGRLVYQMQCATCHGPEGHGDGPSAAELRPPPRDLAAGAWKYGTGPAAVRRVVAEGIPGTAMPGSGQALSAEDLEAVVAHVLTLVRPVAADLGPLLQRAGLAPAAPPRAAPDLELLDSEGARSALSARRGKFVLLVFWETTCLPCVLKLPGLERLEEAFRGRDVEIVAVCLDEGERGALAALARAHLKSLRLYADARGVARLRYDVQVVPHACLLDRAGRLLGSGPGPGLWDSREARDLLRACLGPPAPAGAGDG